MQFNIHSYPRITFDEIVLVIFYFANKKKTKANFLMPILHNFEQ